MGKKVKTHNAVRSSLIFGFTTLDFEFHLYIQISKEWNFSDGYLETAERFTLDVRLGLTSFIGPFSLNMCKLSWEMGISLWSSLLRVPEVVPPNPTFRELVDTYSHFTSPLICILQFDWRSVRIITYAPMSLFCITAYCRNVSCRTGVLFQGWTTRHHDRPDQRQLR